MKSLLSKSWLVVQLCTCIFDHQWTLFPEVPHVVHKVMTKCMYQFYIGVIVVCMIHGRISVGCILYMVKNKLDEQALKWLKIKLLTEVNILRLVYWSLNPIGLHIYVYSYLKGRSEMTSYGMSLHLAKCIVEERFYKSNSITTLHYIYSRFSYCF